jgi:hypothetical protein
MIGWPSERGLSAPQPTLGCGRILRRERETRSYKTTWTPTPSHAPGAVTSKHDMALNIGELMRATSYGYHAIHKIAPPLVCGKIRLSDFWKHYESIQKNGNTKN